MREKVQLCFIDSFARKNEEVGALEKGLSDLKWEKWAQIFYLGAALIGSMFGLVWE